MRNDRSQERLNSQFSIDRCCSRPLDDIIKENHWESFNEWFDDNYREDSYYNHPETYQVLGDIREKLNQLKKR